MSTTPITIKRIPKFERLKRMAARYPALDPTAHEAYLVLLGVAGEVSLAAGANLSTYGMSQGRFQLLAFLLESHPKPLSHTELANLAGATKGNITGLADALERDGYVKRTASGSDRRVTPLALTPAGRKHIERLLPDHFKRIAGLMKGLTLAERKGLVSLLFKVQSGLGALRD